MVKLHKVLKEKYGPKYQSEPLCQTGIGRFQVYETDNANARAIGRRPRWTVIDLYDNVTLHEARELCDTLAEAREWIAKRLDKSSRELNAIS